jgi:hypothetical protein
MREPKEFYPGTLLIAEGAYWMLLPRSNRPLELAPRHVLSGDISNGDLARGNLVAHYRPTLAGEAVIDGEDCWGLELARTSRLAMYPRIRAWITKERFRPWRFEYFGETGMALRVADFRDYRDTPLGVRSLRVEVENRQKLGERTTMTFSKLRKVDSSRLSFTPDGLVTVRGAALLKMETEAAPIEPEELPLWLDRVERRAPSAESGAAAGG